MLDNELNEVVDEVAVVPAKALDPVRKKFNVAVTDFTIKVNPYPTLKKKNLTTTHVVRRPTPQEEERKERMTPLISKSAGKVGESQAQQTVVDIVPGDRYLYREIIKRVHGYRIPGVTDDGSGLDPQTKVKVRDPETKEEVEKLLLDLIPDDHKSIVVNSIFSTEPNRFEIVDSDEVAGYSLVGGQQWTLRQSVGGLEQQDDGTFSEPEYIIEYVFNEPSANDMKTFRTKGFAVKTWNDKNGLSNEERRIILPVVTGLFDSLVSVIDGVEVDKGDSKEEFDLRNPEHLAMVPSSFKKSAVLKLFSFLQADLGKSASA